MSSRDDLTETPIRPPVFHILLALSAGELHGLGIAEEVERATEGTVELGPGTLYRSLKEMSDAGLIEDVPAPDGADARRRYYGITGRGREVVRTEAARLEHIVDVARSRKVLPETA